MIGDNLHIQVELNRMVEVVLVKNTISTLFERLEITVPDSFIFKNTIQEYPGKDDCFSDEFILNYKGNEYEIPACFYATFYTDSTYTLCTFFSISAFNHPGGALLLEHHEEMISKLKRLLDKAGIFQTLLYTNDSKYNTPELFLKYKRGIRPRDWGIVYVL